MCLRTSETSFRWCSYFCAGHFYISQSDKGEMVMGGDFYGYNSYAQKELPTIQHVLTGGIACFFK